MAFQNVAEQYFKSINSIAIRIHSDLQEAKLTHEYIWAKLSQDEKEQILNESIIKPEILIKYQSDKLKTNDEYQSEIVDDNFSYKDEHGGPFSLRTKSQRNLVTFLQESSSSVNKEIDEVVLKPAAPLSFYVQDFELDSRASGITSEKCNDTKLPKTGLDFLDNW